MKMVKCKKCGKVYPKNLSNCPECFEKNKKYISKGRKTTGIIILILGLFLLMVTAVNWDDSVADNSNNSSQPSSSQTDNEQGEKDNTKKNTEKVIYSDSDLKISFIKVSDGADLGVTACYIHLKVENLSEKTVNVSLTDAYANDTAVTLMSGLPMKLAPGKNSKQPFLFGYNEIFTSADEVETLEFKVTLLDENYTDIIKTTKSIKVNVK